MKVTDTVKIIIPLILLVACTAHAQATTYVVPSGVWQTTLGAYEPGMTFSASFTTASPLPANANSGAFGPDLLNLLTKWHVSDGITTFTHVNSLLEASYFNAFTDEDGIISDLEFGFTTPSGPIADGDQVNQIFFQYKFDDPPRYRARALYQRTCETASDGLCDTFEELSSSEAYIETTGGITVKAASIPSNSSLTLVTLIVLLASAGLYYVNLMRRVSRPC